MEKNTFLLINEMIYSLYQWDSLENIKELLFPRLRALIPFSFASILLKDGDTNLSNIEYNTVICYPDFFEEAEQAYLKYAQVDPLDWIVHAGESQVLKESDLIGDDKRLNSPLYKNCYSKYNIFDTLQYSIVYKQQYLGVLTLFRTKEDGDFTDLSMFYLQSIGKHLNAVLFRLTDSTPNTLDQNKLVSSLKLKYALTAREGQVLEKIFELLNNNEIAELLGISENTLLKHIQNIYSKTGVTTKWELLRFQLHI